MSETLMHQLSDWLAATDINLLELRAPGVHVRLRNEGGRIERIEHRPADSGFAAEATLTVCAPSVGVFLHAHPLQDVALAIPGRAVAAGQVIGLMQVGALLLPVTAPQDSFVAAHTAADVDTVGYGAPLVRLRATGASGAHEGPARDPGHPADRAPR